MSAKGFTAAPAKRLICHIREHDWQPTPIRYLEGETKANVGGRTRTVPVTWVCDEVCSRCGSETWWPA